MPMPLLISKTLPLAALCLLVAPQRAPQARLSRLMPPPDWIARRAEALQLSPQTQDRMDAEWEAARDSYAAARQNAEAVRDRFVSALQHDDFDVEASMQVFEELLISENEMKRIQARVRLRTLSMLTPGERQRARSAVERRDGPLMTLRRRIEAVRNMGRRLRTRGIDTQDYRDRMGAVESLIQSRDLDLASELVNEVLADMRQALGR